MNCRRFDLLAYRSLDIESRQIRNNLLFRGIPEVRDEDCIAEVKYFLGDRLGLDNDAISIQRAHRVGRIQRQSANIRKRPLIALIGDYQDVELVLSNANKLQGTLFGINWDYPKEIINARKT